MAPVGPPVWAALVADVTVAVKTVSAAATTAALIECRRRPGPSCFTLVIPLVRPDLGCAYLESRGNRQFEGQATLAN